RAGGGGPRGRVRHADARRRRRDGQRDRQGDQACVGATADRPRLASVPPDRRGRLLRWGLLLTATGGAPTARPGVLFLCVHNAGRSQMAAGWMRALAGDRVDVFSGGSEPASEVNPVAVAAMAEKGIDVGGGRPSRWTDDDARRAEVIVTMGCGDACPVY